MRGILAVLGAVLVGSALGQSDSSKYVDAATGFTFSQFTNEKGISFRVAIPDKVTAGSKFDAVVQIVSPIAVGWAGLAWGGSMTYNPLTIVWANGQNVVLSSRMAYGYFVPPAYDDAKYEVLGAGTFVNATHYQVTAKCTGCTQWGDADTGVTSLDATGQNAFAFAFGVAPVATPSSNTSAFSIHDLIGHWIHDLSQGVNPNFNATVAKAGAAPATPPAGTVSSGNATANATAKATPKASANSTKPTTSKAAAMPTAKPSGKSPRRFARSQPLY